MLQNGGHLLKIGALAAQNVEQRMGMATLKDISIRLNICLY